MNLFVFMKESTNPSPADSVFKVPVKKNKI